MGSHTTSEHTPDPARASGAGQGIESRGAADVPASEPKSKDKSGTANQVKQQSAKDTSAKQKSGKDQPAKSKSGKDKPAKSKPAKGKADEAKAKQADQAKDKAAKAKDKATKAKDKAAKDKAKAERKQAKTKAKEMAGKLSLPSLAAKPKSENRRELNFELAFTTELPRLGDAGLGILASDPDPSRSRERDTTLLDSTDHRLLRAGITLAHRVQDGLGEWYLNAPQWDPWLPTDHVEQVEATADLPADMAFLVRPIRRMATLGPVVSMLVQRSVIDLTDPAGVRLGSLRDERITVRRGGLTTSRLREVVLAPTPAMAGAQKQWLVAQMEAVGAAPVDGFASELRRLGIPGARLSDFPEPREYDAHTTLEHVVSSLFAERLRALVHADLALRAGELARRSAGEESGLGISTVLSELGGFARQLRALAGVLAPDWRAGLEHEVAQVLRTDPTSSVGQLDEHYYAVIDALVSATRAPQLGDASQLRAGSVFRQQAQSGLSIILSRANALGLDSPSDQWEATRMATEQLTIALSVLAPLFGKPGKKMHKHCKSTLKALTPACERVRRPSTDDLAELDPEEAYQRGIDDLRADLRVHQAKASFVDKWPALRRDLLSDRATR